MISNHENLQWQFDWAGPSLVNKRILVSADELDVPQRQLGSLILPPDPPSIMNARPENYDIDEASSQPYTTENGIDQYFTENSSTNYESSG
jgi:hypothetical protein